MSPAEIKEAIKVEYAKCVKDPIYIAKKYTKIQHPTKGKILFNLFPFQESTLQQFFKHTFNIVGKSRQMGISTLVAFFALIKMLFQADFKVVVVCTNQSTAKNIVQKVQIMHENFPSWLRKEVLENNKLGMKFANGSEIKAISSSPNASRSEACSLLIIDEAAFVEAFAEIWTASQSTLATGGSCVILSTPNGVGNLFHQMWVKAISGEEEEGIGGFNAIPLKWDLHPERDQAWRDKETVKLGVREAAQEYDIDFITSGHTVVESEHLQWYINGMCCDPIEKRGPGGDYWIWKYPDYSKDYLVVVDVARGDGADNSAFQVIDVEKNEQVAEYDGKMPTREFGKFVVSVSHDYNKALLVIDNKNIGWDVVQEALDLGYPNLYWSFKTDPYLDENKHIAKKAYDLKHKEDMVPGFTTTTVTRPVMISKMGTYYSERSPIRYSKRLMNQYMVFIYKNGKSQAQQGFKDDLVMADGMSLFLRDTTIKMRAMGLEMTKKALNHIGKSIYTPKSMTKNNPWIMNTGKGFEDITWLL